MMKRTLLTLSAVLAFGSGEFRTILSQRKVRQGSPCSLPPDVQQCLCAGGMQENQACAGLKQQCLAVKNECFNDNHTWDFQKCKEMPNTMGKCATLQNCKDCLDQFDGNAEWEAEQKCEARFADITYLN